VAMPAGAQPFNSGKIKPGGSFEQKFSIPGTYKYVCEPHEEMDMKGQVIVKPMP
jgi:plastocyanin